MRLLAGLMMSFVGLLYASQPVSAIAGWTDQLPGVFVNEEAPYTPSTYCPTFRQTVSVIGEGEHAACLFIGSSISIAQYRSDGHARAALRLPYHDNFFRLNGVCEQAWGCVYSAESDRLAAYERRNGTITVVVYDDVRSRVRLESPLTFQFDASNPTVPFRDESGVFEVPRMGMSPNGRWLTAELKHQGIGLSDLNDRTAGWVDVTGNMYGRGINPDMELAVSDDGQSVAAAGLNMGLKLYDVRQGCLGPLESKTPSASCARTDARVGALIPSLRSVHNPRFDGGGRLLTVQLVSRISPDRTIILRREGEDGRISYLALGDSFVSGEGETDARRYDPRTDTLQNKCRVSGRSYPFLLGVEQAVSVACAGATLADVLSRSQYPAYSMNPQLDFLPGSLPQIEHLKLAQPELTSIGIGGNDAGLMAKLAACAAPGTCFWASEEGRLATAQEIQRLSGKLTAAYEQLAAAAPLTQFIAVGYPGVMSEAGECDSIVGLLFDRREREFMISTLDYLNRIVEAAARAAGIGFLDLSRSYDGHELCSGTSMPAMNGLRLGNDVAALTALPAAKVFSSASFHPTPLGHRLAAKTILTRYGDLRAAFRCPNDEHRCPQNVSTPLPPSGWEDELESGPRYHHTEIVESSHNSGERLSFAIPSGWFAPGSRVSAELRSETVNLGEYVVDETGSLRQEVALPTGMAEGYHTVLARGSAVDGTAIVLYEAVAIGKEKSTSVIQRAKAADSAPPSRKEYTSFAEESPSDASSVIKTDVLGAMSKNDTSDSDEWQYGPVIPMALAGLILLLAVKPLTYGYNGTMTTVRTIVKKLIPRNLFEKIEPYGHLGEAILMNIRHGFPGRKLRVIGVTGTNGKTTTSFFIHRLLQESGIKVGLLTTVAYGVGDDIRPQVQHMTTVQAEVLQRRLRDFARQGVEWVVVETSSHALAQHRVWGVPYEIAVMTNITHEHLDYHGTFKNYVEAKRKLFKLANKRGLRFGVVNAQDPSAEKFVKTVANHTTYGIGEGDLQAKAVKLAADKSRYHATIEHDTYDVTVNVPGEFNVSNSLAAIAVGRKLGLTKSQIEKGIAALKTVEGRMNVIDEGQPFKVIVDFASTPDGFEKLFASVRPLTKGKLIAVFGSAGRRDEAKRPVQGEIAGKNADIVILTEEDDRDIDGNQILKEIATGAKKTGKKEGKDLHLILNREEAIGFAMTQAKSKDDVVVLLGKGHEKTIERADGEYPWNEADVARAALQALKTSNQASK